MAAMAAPALALLCSGLASETFLPADQSGGKRILLIPVLLLIVALGGFAVFCFLQRGEQYPHWVWQLLLAVVLLGGLIISLKNELPRWIFALLFASGVLFGSVMYWFDDSLPQDIQVPFEQLNLAQELIPAYVLIAAALCFWIMTRLLYGRTMPKLRHDGREYHYGAANFRLYSNAQRKFWEGEPVYPEQDISERYHFAVFGDVTGAESPFSSRRSAYFVFRALAHELRKSRPAFAISLGDLATQAAALPYRRVRQLLRHISVPLTVVPGNHDLFVGAHYRIEYFHALFGADTLCFRVGAVKYILLNNARGSIGEEQFEWLQKALHEAPSPFTLVFCHKPPFDLRANKFYAMENREDAQRLHDLFKAHGVTAVFSGHIHSLLSEMREGVTYIISGGGGSKLVSPTDAHHYLDVEVFASEIIVRALPLQRRKLATPEPLLELHFSNPSNRDTSCTSADPSISPAPRVSC
jgi:predicted phosphodiesterase